MKQPNDPQPPDLCLASRNWQQNSLAEPATVTVAQMGGVPRPPWATPPGQPQPGKSVEKSRVVRTKG